MSLLICQISDIHFREGRDNKALIKVEKIRDVILSNFTKDDSCIILITGDIAYSGRKEEYDIAEKFIISMLDILSDTISDLKFLLVPGNHDCNFELDNHTRKALIESVLSNGNIDQSIIDNVVFIQEDFFKFCNVINNSYSENKINSLHQIEIGEHKVLFNLINTAWMSRKMEIQGKVIVPLQYLQEFESTDYDVVLTVFHHPYNWIESNNKRTFKEMIDKSSDIIFTGHEHATDTFTISRKEQKINDVYEGGILQAWDTQKSDFNIIKINISEKKYLFNNYIWHKDFYKKDKDNDNPEWLDFKRNRYIENNTFNILKPFKEYLNDIGAAFSHPNKDSVLLDDLFVFPNLKLVNEKPNKTKIQNIDSQDINKMLINKKVLISGEEKSGKTCLAKLFYKSFNDIGNISLLVNASDFNENDKEKISKVIISNFNKQYDSNLWEKYLQLPKNKKILIIDDFHKTKLNAKGKSLLLQNLYELYDTIFIFVDESFLTEQLLNQSSLSQSLLNLTQYYILKFGHFLRSKLIQKWVLLGNEYSLTAENMETKTVEYERVINNILGKNLIPSYPIFILMILQQLEASKKTLTPDQSSYGYLYGALITSSLMNISKSPDDIDMYYTYLSELAFRVFSQKNDIISNEDIIYSVNTYNEKYTMHLSFDIVKKFEEVKILTSMQMICPHF